MGLDRQRNDRAVGLVPTQGMTWQGQYLSPQPGGAGWSFIQKAAFFLRTTTWQGKQFAPKCLAVKIGCCGPPTMGREALLSRQITLDLLSFKTATGSAIRAFRSARIPAGRQMADPGFPLCRHGFPGLFRPNRRARIAAEYL
jgi:hypothetical protein